MCSTICHLRQKYWIPTIRQCVKSQLRKCTTCRMVNSKPYIAPDPPPLPTYRLENSPPFTVTGIDFSGVLYVREKIGIESKAYVCLFTCASTRAIHLELVHDLTEESFMQAFRRFVSRRSLPQLIISDNGKIICKGNPISQKNTSHQSLPFLKLIRGILY